MPTDRARILIATAGTWGDLLPFVELGRRLTSRGHDVAIACATGLHAWVARAGLKALTFDGDFGKEKAQNRAKHWNQWDQQEGTSLSLSSPEAESNAFVNKLETNSRRLARLAENADLLLTPSNCPEGRLAHELSDVPWISVIFIPEDGLQPRETTSERFAKAMSEVIRRLGSCEPFTTNMKFKRSQPTLFACSSVLGEALDPNIRQTSFWFYEDPAWESWRPDQRLLRFMEDEEPPLILSFSSLPLENAKQVLEVHVRAAQMLKRRLVVQQGWSGFSKELLPPDIDPEQVYMADFLPHDWFFSRAGGLITHGGIGTLGRALRNACPLLVEPYGNDQFFNALLLKRLELGTAVHPHRLTPENLAEVIQRKVLDPPLRARLESSAAILRKEDGVLDACLVIEEILGKRGEVA